MADTFYKNPTGGLVNTQFADKSLQGGQTYDVSGNKTATLTTPDTSTITPTNINPNTPSVTVPQTPVSNTPNAVISNASVAPNPYQDLIDQQNKTVSDTGTEKGSARNLVTSLMERLGNQTGREAQLNQEAGLPDRVKQYNQYTNDINALTASTEKQIQDISKGSLGPVSAEAAQAKANEIRRDNAYEITMKEIARSTAGNDITRLQSSIKNQLEIEFGPVKAQLETAKFLYDDLKDTFSKAEQRQFELQYQAKKDEVARKEADKTAVGDIIQKALENGVNLPASVAEQMMRDGTKQGALSILTKNGINLGGIDLAIKQAQLSNASLDRREKLLKLAKDGDKKAMTELGINNPLEASKEEANLKINKDISRIDGLLSNRLGLNISAGTVRGLLPTVAGATVAGAGAGTALGGPTGAIAGGIFGLGSSVLGGTPAKQKFLNDIDYLATNLTFDKFKELADQGVKLTPVSEKELAQIAKSSSELATAIRRDSEGNIKSIDLPEREVTRILSDIKERYQRVRDEQNIRDGFSTDELLELQQILQ